MQQLIEEEKVNTYLQIGRVCTEFILTHHFTEMKEAVSLSPFSTLLSESFVL